MTTKPHPKQEELRRLFDYRENGDLVRRVSVTSNARKGQIAGGPHPTGYLKVSVNGTKFNVHRLVWIWHYGDILRGREIDHRNGVRDDNRIDNLRQVTHQENQFNVRSARGISFDKASGLWRAQICVDQKRLTIGRFPTRELALEAYEAKKKELHRYSIDDLQLDPLTVRGLFDVFEMAEDMGKKKNLRRTLS